MFQVTTGSNANTYDLNCELIIACPVKVSKKLEFSHNSFHVLSCLSVKAKDAR